MRRTIFLWTLVLCLISQGMVFAFVTPIRAERGDTTHERVHRDGLSHHHGVDGSLEFDDSVSAVLHMTADSSSPASLVPATAPATLRSANCMPRVSDVVVPPTAYLEGALRPPRSTV